MDDDLRMLRVLLTAPAPSPEATERRRRQLQDAIASRDRRPGMSRLADLTRGLGRVAFGPPASTGPGQWRFRVIAASVAASAAAVTCGVLLLGEGATPANAWTVTKEPGGAVAVTIRQLNNPNALLRELRRDGIPANFDGPPTTTPAGTINWSCLRPATPALRRALTVRVSSDPHAAAFLLHPSAIPAGTTLSIFWADYSPHGFAHSRISAGGTLLVPSSSRPGARKVWRHYQIPLTISGDFAFHAAFVTPAGRCVQ